MRRRDFIKGLFGSAATWAFAARAQQAAARLPTVGLVSGNSAAGASQWVDVFVQRLNELGWAENRNVTIDYRWADGRSERIREMASEIVGLKVDVIVTAGTLATIAAKESTSNIPIIFAAVSDPVGTGIVASLAQPGGNVTGLSLEHGDTVGKRLELIREVVPNLRRLAIMANIDTPGATLEMKEAAAAAQALPLETLSVEVHKASDLTAAFEQIKGRADALYVCTDPLVNTNRRRINELALAVSLPTVHGVREYVESGGLMSYGPSFAAMYRRTAELVDKVLRGAKVVDIPVEQPTKFELIVNRKTAKALGLSIPESILLRADEVIE